MPFGRALPPSAEAVSRMFDSQMTLTNIVGTPFGTAVAGNGPRRVAYSVTSRDSSTDLLGRGNRANCLVDAFVSAVDGLYNAFGNIVILLHFFRGDIRTEPVSVRLHKSVSIDMFKRLYPRLEDDVRYTIVRGS
jgi:hypothetical protein